jgi:ABC-type polysaccharide/polyol phosphate transport system ATPase subunit
MSSEYLLRAKGIGKTYSGSKKPLSTLWQALFGAAKNTADQYPVLSDIDIEIKSGETVGIMGRNGAGKTTLLGILGNVIEPTTGTVERSGRIATLLGLTAGFNPNFSGRENAYLFCSIQGISRTETDSRIGAIEAFADLGRYFEMPLQSYSSGMQSRLAFSCAVHVDANLIIIDETLAVGDSNFRMKCYERIRQMKEDGQTFLLVSHNQNLVANFCTRGIVLEGGRKIFDGGTFAAVEAYKQVRTDAEREGGSVAQVRAVKKSREAGRSPLDAELLDLKIIEFSSEAGSRVVVTGILRANRSIEHVTLNIGIRSNQGIALCSWDGSRGSTNAPSLIANQRYPVKFTFHQHLLPGRYFITCSVHELVGDVNRRLALYQHVLAFDVVRPVYDPQTGLVDLRMQAFVEVERLILDEEKG